MAIRINSNVASTRAITDLSKLDRDTQSHRSRLSSGQRINSGRDDGGRLAISEGMRAEIGGLAEGARNAEKAIDLLRVAQGGMTEISGILVRMRGLATEASTDTISDRNREALDAEFIQLKDYIDRIARLAKYNHQNLLSGFGNEVSSASTALTDSLQTGVDRIALGAVEAATYTFTDNAGDGTITLDNGVTSQTLFLDTQLSGGRVADNTTVVANFDKLGIEVILAGDGVDTADGSYEDGDLDGKTIVVESGVGGRFQLGGDADEADRLEYDIPDMTIGGSVLNISGLSINTMNGARATLAQIDEAVDRVALQRGGVGAIVNRLEHTVNFTTGAIESVTASESTVRDTDYAFETSMLARGEILAEMSRIAMVQSRIPVDIVMGLIA